MIGHHHSPGPPAATPTGKPVNIVLATIAAMGAIFVGLGLARFAFGPLQPALVIDGWFSGSTSSLLTAANLAGYLFGALAGVRLARRFPAVTVLRVMMLLTALSFFACASESFPFAWFFSWRVLSGFTGGVLMALAGPTVLVYVAEKRRPAIGGEFDQHRADELSGQMRQVAFQPIAAVAEHRVGQALDQSGPVRADDRQNHPPHHRHPPGCSRSTPIRDRQPAGRFCPIMDIETPVGNPSPRRFLPFRRDNVR